MFEVPYLRGNVVEDVNDESDDDETRVREYNCRNEYR